MGWWTRSRCAKLERTSFEAFSVSDDMLLPSITVRRVSNEKIILSTFIYLILDAISTLMTFTKSAWRCQFFWKWTQKKLLILCYDRRFIRRCKQGGLQFVILKPILVAVTFILYSKGKYEDGDFSAKQSYLYITIIYTISYSVALYALALFYVACRDLLHPFNPVPKFILIKSVVFLTYWQVLFPNNYELFCKKFYMFFSI